MSQVLSFHYTFHLYSRSPRLSFSLYFVLFVVSYLLLYFCMPVSLSFTLPPRSFFLLEFRLFLHGGFSSSFDLPKRFFRLSAAFLLLSSLPPPPSFNGGSDSMSLKCHLFSIHNFSCESNDMKYNVRSSNFLWQCQALCVSFITRTTCVL